MDELITIAVFRNGMEAGRAKERLGYVGIQSVLKQQSLEGEIQLDVGQKDAQAALDFLAQETWKIRMSVDEKTSFATARTLEILPPARAEDVDEKPLSPREKLAIKTFRLTIFGLVIPVLLPIALLFLGRLCFSKGKLEGRPRHHAKFAGLILCSLLLFTPAVLCAGILFPSSDEVDLRQLAHPDVFVGTWTGKTTVQHEEIAIAMDLRSNGKIRYQESGASGVDATGTWAYTKHGLYFRLDRFKKGTRPWKSKIVGWEIEQYTDHEMVLKEEAGKLRLLRQR